METIKKIIFLLSPEEKKHAIFLLVMMAVMSVLDTIGIASIIPFLGVMMNPELIETNFILKEFFQLSNEFGVKTYKEFIFVLGIGMFIILIFSISFKALTTYLLLHFASMREYSIGKRLIEGYISQPYSWILHNHSTEIGTKILSESGNLANRGIMTLMNFVSKSLVAFAILVLLFMVNFKIALIVGLTVLLAYVIIYKLVSNLLKIIGYERLKSNKLRFFFVNEAFTATKEIKVSGLEKHYVNHFLKPAKKYAETSASMNIMGELPRYALEALLFGGITGLTLYLFYLSGTYSNVIPLIALYAFAGYRLMPAIQEIYNTFISLKTIGPSLDDLHEDLKNLKPKINKTSSNIDNFLLKKEIVLQNISFKYLKAPIKALKNINLKIPARSSVAIVGATGSGKTTMVDIILGLLQPQEGRLEIDGKQINEFNTRSWQSIIGYVPQQIYLSDDTIAANIAFGINSEDINIEDVKAAAKVANLHEFIVNELPLQYQTKIGERGARLSGGQRQRIGIARALYGKPKLLIMDEGTSALDVVTEKEIMNAIENLDKNITVIIIAHRLNLVKKCDKIFLLENGELIDSGNFENLMNNNQKFKLFNLKDEI